MLFECLVKSLAGGQSLRQCGIGHQTMLWWESLIARVSPRVRPGIRTPASCPSHRTPRSGIGAGGFGSCAGAAMADAGTGVAVAGAAEGVAVAADVDWMYTYPGVSSLDDEWGTFDPTVGAREIGDSRGWCHISSRECTTLPVSASMILKQSLPRLYLKFRKKQGRAWGSILLRRGTRWYAGLQNGKIGIGGQPPKNTLCGENMPLFAVVVGWLNPSDAHKTYSIHKLEPSGSRTPLSLSRCTSGKSLLTSRSATCPALIALGSALHWAVLLRRVWGRQFAADFEAVTIINKRRVHVLVPVVGPQRSRNSHVGHETLHRTPRVAGALLSLAPYERWKREALSTNMMTHREPPSHSWNGPAVSMCTMFMGAAPRDVVVRSRRANSFAIEHPEHRASSPTS